MFQKDESPEYVVHIMQVPDELCQILILELAWDCRIRAWTQGRTKTKVWLRVKKEDLDPFIEKAVRAMQLLQVFKWEALARAILAVGNRPSDALIEDIEKTKFNTGLESNKDNSLPMYRRNDNWGPGAHSDN